jgi:hypothetical protein
LKREFVGNVVASISENLQTITQNGLAGDYDLVDPPLLAGYLKFRFYVHVRYLIKMLHWFGKTNYNCLKEPDINQKMDEIFKEIPEEYYNKKMSSSPYTFNEFWKELQKDKGIQETKNKKYKNTKVQTCLLWHAMFILFHPIIANSPKYYLIETDRYDSDDGLPIITCKNTYFEKALSMIINQHLFSPVDPKWKESNEKATFKITINEINNLNENILTKETETKKLGDFWDEYHVAFWMHDETLLTASSLFHHIQTDLMQSLAELQTVLTFHLYTISSDIDFAGVPWEVGPLIEKERDELKKLKKQTDSLIDTNKSLAITVETYRNKEWEEEIVYSTSSEEKLRELIGETAKKLGIKIATRKNLEEFPGCRWIIRCTRRGNGKITGIEGPLSIWRDACLHVGLDFWNKSEIENGLYFLVDGEIIKGVMADPKLGSKIYNAFREDRMNNAQRKQAVLDIINQLDSSIFM